MAETDEVRGLIQDWDDMLVSKLYWQAAAKRAEADRLALLEALHTFIERMSDLIPSLPDDLVDTVDADIQAARAAIAKAEEDDMDKLGDILRDGIGVNVFIDDVRKAVREAYEAEAEVCEEHDRPRYARDIRAEGKKVDKLLAAAQKAVAELAG